ncbi:hypothetical protein ACFVGN_09545 [Streptomyces sp. NPDC057757]|uniref:hypothetical protein n=1 Tax=Streptomyces sp. NPDC057757 TaxID=3346241 RepID=UPI0036AAFDF3
MIEQPKAQGPEEAWHTRRRRTGIAAFVIGLAATLAFFAFFPGLPHVIDWGAILVSLAVGGLAQWICRSWVTRTAKEEAERR